MNATGDPLKYPTGEYVQLGDRVRLGVDSGGQVVCVLDTGEFSSAYPKDEWAYLQKGVLIRFPIHGLIYYDTTLETDLEFISRGAPPT